jgi:hypothetical protein
MTFLDPLTKKPHSRLADAYVDDTMLGKSDSGDLSYEDLIGRPVGQHIIPGYWTQWVQ